MKNIVDVKNRIRSINDTSKITKAMELISVSKRRKANVKYKNNHTYFEKVRATIKDILAHSQDISHPYLKKREHNKTAFVVISSDKGLAGDYNHRILKLAMEEIKKVEDKYIFSIGQMAKEFFIKNGITPDVEFLHCAQNPNLEDARQITEDLVSLFNEEHIDEVKIIYTRMEKNVNKPAMIHMLPLQKEDFEDAKLETNYKANLEFFPSSKAVFDILVPQYILGMVYSTLIESVACEHSERMKTMNNANKNAVEILDTLQIEFNRARQETITNEIAEISSASILANK